jgi:hypothetical protein
MLQEVAKNFGRILENKDMIIKSFVVCKHARQNKII